MKKLAVILAMGFLCACAATARPPLESALTVELTRFQATPKAARLYFSIGHFHRNSLVGETSHPTQQRGQITIDGKETATVGPNEFIAIDLNPGVHEITWLPIGASQSSVAAKVLRLNAVPNTVRIISLEYYDDKPAAAGLLMGFGAIGGAISGAMSAFRTELAIVGSTEFLRDRVLVDYKRL